MLRSKLNAPIILSMVIVALFITNCGNSSSADEEEGPLVGTWDLTQMIISSIIFKDTLTPGVDDVSGTVALNGDGTYNSNVEIHYIAIIANFPITIDTTMSSTGNWSSTDSTITFTDPQLGEQISSYEINDNTMKTASSIAISIYNINLTQTWVKQ